jgi:hypothetical protein
LVLTYAVFLFSLSHQPPYTLAADAVGPSTLSLDEQYTESFESSDTAWYDGF